MTTLNATSDTVSTIDADALILGFDGSVLPHAQLPDDVRDTLSAAASDLDASGKVGTVTVLPGTGVSATRVVVVGVGDGSAADLRLAAGAAARACGTKPSTVVVALPAHDDVAAQAVGEGALLGAYTFTDYKSDGDAPTDTDADAAPEHDTDWLIAGASEAAVEKAKIVAGAVAGSRDLTNMPPIDLFPASFAEIAESFARPLGVEVEVWDPQRLATEGFGGILAVGMGSSRLPRLVKLSWRPEGGVKHVALVGKGITFDTGGISLKPPKSMETMKSDMSGAAAVLHTVLAAARAGIAVNVTGWLCLAENMPSGTAQRPSDVIRIYGGTTVEVLNTDAEGRLVMADGLVKAREESPDVLIDIATLTGAQGIALGTRTSGVMGSAEVRDAIVAAADDVAEPMWAMPLPDHLRADIDSKIADLQNIGDGTAGMLSAGVFLKEFVGDTPWAHMDIARPAFNEKGAWGFTPPGGTGAGVRTLLQFLESTAT